MAMARRKGRQSAVSSMRWEGDADVRPGIDAHHAHNSARMLNDPAGNAGTVGPSAHQTPRQGCGV